MFVNIVIGNNFYIIYMEFRNHKKNGANPKSLRVGKKINFKKMTKMPKILVAFILASTLLTSCGKKESEEKMDIPSTVPTATTETPTTETPTTETPSSEATTDETASTGDDCEAFCKEYEEFADNYVALMKKYKKNPADASILSEYTDMVSQATDMQGKAKDCAGDAKVAARLSKVATKMASALR